MDALELVPNVFFGKLNSFALLSIPMFIIMGAAIGSTRAGAHLYEALDRWLIRVPGGLVVSNRGACALFAAMSSFSPATCAAIGKMGIPEMRRRGHPDAAASGSIAAGGTLDILIPPSVTMIVYRIATETSIGRLLLAGVVPGLLLVALFMAWAIFDTWRQGGEPMSATRARLLAQARRGAASRGAVPARHRGRSGGALRRHRPPSETAAVGRCCASSSPRSSPASSTRCRYGRCCATPPARA